MFTAFKPRKSIDVDGVVEINAITLIDGYESFSIEELRVATAKGTLIPPEDQLLDSIHFSRMRKFSQLEDFKTLDPPFVFRRIGMSNPTQEQEAQQRKEQEAQQRKEQEAQPRKEQEAQPWKEKEAQPRKEQEAQPRKEQEAQPRKEQEAQPRKEQETQPRKEQETQPRKKQEAQPRKKQEAQPWKEQEAQPRKEQEAQPMKEQEAQQKKEQEFEEPKEEFPQLQALKAEAIKMRIQLNEYVKKYEVMLKVIEVLERKESK